MPLKKVDAISVAEGLLELIANTGIPHELLSDQGSVFVGRLNKELCRLLDITKLKPQPTTHKLNGVLKGDTHVRSFRGNERRLGGGAIELQKLSGVGVRS